MTTQELQTKLEQFLGQSVSVSAVKHLSNGWEADVYAFKASGGPFPAPRDLILRIFSGEMLFDKLGVEAHAMRQLRPAGYPVPELLAAEPDPRLFGGPFLIMERILGQPMWRFFPIREEWPERLSDLMVRLHRIETNRFLSPAGPWKSPGDSVSSFSVAFLAEKFGVGRVGEAFTPLFDRVTQQEQAVGREPHCLIHGDLHLENVLVTQDGAPYVIDWSSAALDDPRMDVAQTVVLAVTNGNPAMGQAFRAAYEARLGRALPEFDHFELVALARRVGSMVVTAVHGAATLGMRAGLELELRKKLPQLRQLVDLLALRSGLELRGVHLVLNEIPQV